MGYDLLHPKSIKIKEMLAQGFTYKQVADHLKTTYNISISSEGLRKFCKNNGINKHKLFFNQSESVEPKSFKDLVEEEKVRVKETQNKRLNIQQVKEQAQMELLLESIKEAIGPADFSKIPKYTPGKLTKKDEEVIVLHLSDLQIGRKTKDYNSEVFVQRLGSLKNSLKKITYNHRECATINELVIALNGDVVDGESIFPGHAFSIDQDVLNQVFRIGVPALKEFLVDLSSHYSKITIYCTPGNHGRNGSKFDANPHCNWDTVLYEALSLACQTIKNVTFNISHEWYITYEILGHGFLQHHGDAIRMWQSIPVYGMFTKSLKWSGSVPGKWDYLLLGHFSSIAYFRCNNKKIIVNGGFVTSDPYVTSQLGMLSAAEQNIFGVHAKQGVSFKYDIDLTK